MNAIDLLVHVDINSYRFTCVHVDINECYRFTCVHGVDINECYRFTCVYA